jgi:hypothetical protein
MDRRLYKRRITAFSLALLATASLIPTFVRVISFFKEGHLFPTTGGTGHAIYSVWRMMHGYPLYEWPDREPFALTLYNYLFYFLYSKWMLITGAQDTQIIIFGGLLTLIFAALGAITHFFIIRKICGKDFFWIAASISVFSWFGSNFASWWILSLRPDVLATLFAMLALFLIIGSLERSSTKVWNWVAASVIFYLGWAVKHSCIWTLAGVILFSLLTQRKLREVIWIGAPFALLAGITLIIGDPLYRYNLLVAPMQTIYSYHQAVEIIKSTLIPNALIWIPAAILVFQRIRSKIKDGKPLIKNDPHSLLLIVFVIGVLGATATMPRAGASKNYYFEPYMTAAVLAAAFLVNSIRNMKLNLALISLTLIFPVIQLVFFNQLGTLTLASEQGLHQKERLKNYFDTLPKPIFSADEILSLPWYSTGNHYPTFIFDASYHGLMIDRRAAGYHALVELFNKHKFGSVVLRANDWGYETAVKAGYQAIRTPDEFKKDIHVILLAPTHANSIRTAH